MEIVGKLDKYLKKFSALGDIYTNVYLKKYTADLTFKFDTKENLEFAAYDSH